MYYSSHLVVGATVGLVTGHPVKAFIAGLASHIMLDLIPHHDHEKVGYCIADVVGSTVLFVIWAVGTQPGWSIIVGAIAGVVPDLEVPLYYYRLIPARYFPSHSGWTPHSKAGHLRGVAVQIVVIGLGIWAIS